MRRILLLTVLSLGLFTADAAAQPPGGGRGRGQNPEFRTRFMFAQLCFDLNATDAQVTKSLPIFREALAKQKAIMQKYSEPTEEAMNEMKQAQTDLETKVKAMLTPEQQKKLADLEAQAQQMRERFQGGGGPPR